MEANNTHNDSLFPGSGSVLGSGVSWADAVRGVRDDEQKEEDNHGTMAFLFDSGSQRALSADAPSFSPADSSPSPEPAPETESPSPDDSPAPKAFTFDYSDQLNGLALDLLQMQYSDFVVKYPRVDQDDRSLVPFQLQFSELKDAPRDFDRNLTYLYSNVPPSGSELASLVQGVAFLGYGFISSVLSMIRDPSFFGRIVSKFRDPVVFIDHRTLKIYLDEGGLDPDLIDLESFKKAISARDAELYKALVGINPTGAFPYNVLEYLDLSDLDSFSFGAGLLIEMVDPEEMNKVTSSICNCAIASGKPQLLSWCLDQHWDQITVKKDVIFTCTEEMMDLVIKGQLIAI